MSNEKDLVALKEAILEGDDDIAEEIVSKLLAGDLDPIQIIEQAVKPGLDVVGTKLVEGEMFIPDLILAGEAAKKAIDLITPKLQKSKRNGDQGKILLGVVEGDTHDIGKNIVRAMLIAAGFEVVDLDTNVPPEKFIESIKNNKPDIVGASAYTSATAVEIGNLNEAFIKAGVRDSFKLVIGGAGVYRDDVVRFGADAFGYDALEAVQICQRMVKLAKKV